MTKKRRCGACGSLEVQNMNVKGRYFPFMSFPKLQLQKDVILSVCTVCDNIVMAKGDASVLDKGLEASAINQSRIYIETILKRMGWNQNEMADFIGFTPVYLSEVKNGKKIPEYKSFNYFKILSTCPGAIEAIVEDDPRFDKTREYPFVGATKADKNEVIILDIAGNDYAMAA